MPEYSEHYFISDYLIENPSKIEQFRDYYWLQHCKRVWVMAGENYSWQDIESFCQNEWGEAGRYYAPILHVTGKEPISKILTVCGVFNSGSAAKKSGWLKPIAPGYSEIEIGKRDKKREFIFWYPKTKWEHTLL